MNPNNKPPSYEGNEPYIFVSYSHNQQERIYDILWKLQNRGVRFWYDDSLNTGENWETGVKLKMKNAASVWFFFDINFFNSFALKREVRFVADNKINYAPIYYTGQVYRKIYGAVLNGNDPVDDDAEVLFSKVFSNKILGIVRDESEESFIEKLVIDAQKKNTLAYDVERTRSVPTKKVLFIGKNSVFTKAIVAGISKVFSENGGFEVKCDYVEPSSHIPQNIQFSRKMSAAINAYDGIIIRPIGLMNENSFSVFQQLCESTKVILCDNDISKEQRSRLGANAPIYVCSDFEKGGEKMGRFINRLCFLFGKETTDVVIATGPKGNAAFDRSNEIVKTVLPVNYSLCKTVELHSLDVNDCFEKLACAIKELPNKKISARTLIVYAGNDNVALHFAKNAYNILSVNGDSIATYKKIVILGYDGIRGITGNSILEECQYDYATMDTIAQRQGEILAESMKNVLCGLQCERIVKVQPKLLAKITANPKIVSKLEAVKPIIKDTKLFILDLDGTIADTETLHWEAYNKLLERMYGVVLSDANISRYIGNPEVKIYRMIERDYNIVIDTETFLRERIKEYLNLVRDKNLQPFDWVKDFTETYSGTPIMLLTSQIPEVVDSLIEYWGLDTLIPAQMRISVHDGSVSKTEVFNNPARYANCEELSETEITVFEDSDHVATIAYAQGYNVIGIRHRYNATTLKHCHVIIDQNLQKGLFVGLGGVDLVYSINNLPEENGKVRTDKYSIEVGGPALKAALTCAQLGGDATLITGVGSSPLGKIIENACDEYGVKLIDIMETRKTPNISCVAINRINSSRTIISGQLPNEEIKILADSFFEEFDYCLYDCNLPTYSKRLAESLQSSCVPLILDCGAFKENIEYVLSCADVVISSEKFVSPEGEDIFELKKRYNIKEVAKTRGEKSVLFETENKIGEIDVQSRKNVSTVGAGDVLHGAFCYFKFCKKENFVDALTHATEVATNYVK